MGLIVWVHASLSQQAVLGLVCSEHLIAYPDAEWHALMYQKLAHRVSSACFPFLGPWRTCRTDQRQLPCGKAQCMDKASRAHQALKPCSSSATSNLIQVQWHEIGGRRMRHIAVQCCSVVLGVSQSVPPSCYEGRGFRRRAPSPTRHRWHACRNLSHRGCSAQRQFFPASLDLRGVLQTCQI